MLRFMSFSSGSCGNCYYLGNGDRGVLIDAGVSLSKLRKDLAANGLSESSFSSILVTHNHADHVRNIGPFCKKLHRPVYVTDVLKGALLSRPDPEYVSGCLRVLEPDVWNDVDGFSVRYFIVPHDAVQTVGYAISAEGHRFVIMTDIGRMTDEAVAFARQADTVVLESNYDMDMLMAGPYTYDLKMRIVQGCGHLSNDECAAAVRRFVHPGLKNIFLCHLSENNNTPRLAYDCSAAALRSALSESGDTANIPSLRCLPRRTASPLFILGD